MPNECPVADFSRRPDQPHKMPGCRVVALFWVRPNHHEQRNGEQKGWEQWKQECTSRLCWTMSCTGRVIGTIVYRVYVRNENSKNEWCVAAAETLKSSDLDSRWQQTITHSGVHYHMVATLHIEKNPTFLGENARNMTNKCTFINPNSPGTSRMKNQRQYE